AGDRGVVRLRVDAHAGPVARDDVAGDDGVVGPGGAVEPEGDAGPVSQRPCPGGIDADVVAGDHGAVGPVVIDRHPPELPAGDDVALGGVALAVAVGADAVVLGPHHDPDDVAVVVEQHRPGCIGADVVTGHDVAVGAGIGDQDAP